MRKTIPRAQNKVDLHNLGSHDLLSRLPDEILVSILSSLPLKDAAVTSLLSKRWRYLWCETDSLVFEDRERWSLICTGQDFRYSNADRNKYMSWVSNIIHQHKSHTIDKFKICFGLDENAKGAISEWIEFAISKNVRTLELNLLRKDITCGNYCFPDEIFDRKCGSSLKQHSFNVLVMEIKFLTSLVLKRVDVNDEGLKKILSNCPVLEHLSIWGSDKLEKVEIHGKDLALKNLDILSCYELEAIEICDPNLVSFNYWGSPICLRLNNLQKLEKICMSKPYSWEKINDMFYQISCGAPYLQALELNLYCLKGTMEIRPFYKVQNLKQLTIEVVERDEDGLLVLTSLVEACPNLQRLTIIKFGCFSAGRTSEVREMAKKPHQRLEVVEIECYGGINDIELAMYFIQNCVALKKLVLEPTMVDKNGARFRAQQLLEPRTPVGVDLVIL